MRLGLIGWFGHQNAGDEQILRCLKRLFAGEELVVAQSYGHAAERLEELNACDFVVLGGGGLIVRDLNRFAFVFESLRPPLGCLGIGVEARHADNEAMIQVLLDRAEFILVRDRASRARLDHHAKVLLAPDLTFLDPFDVVDWSPHGPCAVNLRPWPFWKAEFQGRGDRLIRRLAKRIRGMETVYPLAKWRPRRAVETIRRHFPATIPLPLFCPAEEPSDATVLKRFFTEVEAAFSPHALARCGYLVGMRLHSLLFACQMGIPFVSLSYQPKNKAFCEDAGVPSASVDIYCLDRLDRALAEMVDQAASRRRRLLAVREQNARTLRQTIEPLVRIIRNSARRRPPKPHLFSRGTLPLPRGENRDRPQAHP